MSAHNVRTMSARCRHNVRTIFFGFQLWQYLLSIWAVKAGASTILSVKLTSFSLKTTWVLRNFPTTYKIIIKNSSSIPFFLYLNFINAVKWTFCVHGNGQTDIGSLYTPNIYPYLTLKESARPNIALNMGKY